MLIEFRVKNYCCLRDEQVLSLVPSSDTSLLESNTYETGVPSVPRLLRTAVIYGPNAGGKSTVLQALQSMLGMVLLSGDLKKEETLVYAPFLLDTTSRKEPTAFEVSFLHVRQIVFSKNTFWNIPARARQRFFNAPMTAQAIKIFIPLAGRYGDLKISGATPHKVMSFFSRVQPS